MADIKTLTLDNIIYNLRDSRIDEGVGGAAVYPATITLLSTDWVDNEQTVLAEHVTADNNVMCTYAPNSKVACTDADIYCIAQDDGELTFRCEDVPEEDIDINILVITYQDAPEPEPTPEPHIYGVTWDGSATNSLQRTNDAEEFADPVAAVANGDGSSPFDTLYPWSEIERVENEDGGTLVKIPKYWYQWNKVGNRLSLRISDQEIEGYSVSPAHANRYDGVGERDYVYVGAYHCASGYKSTSGVLPIASMTRATARTQIKTLGTGFYQYDYAMYWTIMMLYLVEYANWNSQAVIGYGCGNGVSAENNGSCDAMIYHTGTNAETRTTYGHVRYRYIEGLWDNVRNWCDGIYFGGEDNKNIFVQNIPDTYTDNNYGTLVCDRPIAGGYITGWSLIQDMLYPYSVDSSGLYVPDYHDYSSWGTILNVGGNYNQSLMYGAFFFGGYDGADAAGPGIGCRLQYLPF